MDAFNETVEGVAACLEQRNESLRKLLDYIDERRAAGADPRHVVQAMISGAALIMVKTRVEPLQVKHLLINYVLNAVEKSVKIMAREEGEQP